MRRRKSRFRDVEWLSAFCCDPTTDPDKSALARDLCALAVERFCEPPSDVFLTPLSPGSLRFRNNRSRCCSRR